MRAILADARRRLLAGAVRVAAALGAVLLAVVYWLVLGPVALTLRVLGVDLLGVRGKPSTAWTPVENPDPKPRLEGAG
ncbi:MAG: hypothetical protein HYX59_06795 [Elusimicrobia bacterium]|nr:hypothetical protein [Elusimicrobiota bacterium]